jgi:hypothetical protein
MPARPLFVVLVAVLRSAVVATFAASLACSGELGAPTGAFAQAPIAEVAAPVAGVADRGSDPAVVAVERAGAVVCAGALVAPDVVLTARHCVTASGVDLFVRAAQGGAAAPRSAVRAVATPPSEPSGALDIALLLLDTPIDGVVPLAVRPTGVALGDHVRTVTFDGVTPGVPSVRDHVPVVAESATEALLDEVPCAVGCGGPAIDEATAAVVGVLSRPAPGDGGPGGDIAARTDVVLSFVAGVVAESGAAVASGSSLRTTKGPVDFGATCGGAADCAAGVCVLDGPKRYCSRSCGAADRCPARSRCTLCRLQTSPATGPTGPGFDACVES